MKLCDDGQARKMQFSSTHRVNAPFKKMKALYDDWQHNTGVMSKERR